MKSRRRVGIRRHSAFGRVHRNLSVCVPFSSCWSPQGSYDAYLASLMAIAVRFALVSGGRIVPWLRARINNG